jgi:hypothetical protein
MTNSVLGTLFESFALRNEASFGAPSKIIKVKPVQFEDCLRRFGIPYYAKIDIEGADLVCLRALRLFPQRPSYVSIESEKIDFEKLRQEFDLLEELGYTGFQAIRQDTISPQRVPSRPREGAYAPHSGASGLFGRELDGAWKTKDEILVEYESVFALYRALGDFCWYDTHAKHCSEFSSI